MLCGLSLALALVAVLVNFFVLVWFGLCSWINSSRCSFATSALPSNWVRLRLFSCSRSFSLYVSPSVLCLSDETARAVDMTSDMGTAAYMAPELASSKLLDDIDDTDLSVFVVNH